MSQRRHLSHPADSLSGQSDTRPSVRPFYYYYYYCYYYYYYYYLLPHCPHTPRCQWIGVCAPATPKTPSNSDGVLEC